VRVIRLNLNVQTLSGTPRRTSVTFDLRADILNDDCIITKNTVTAIVFVEVKRELGCGGQHTLFKLELEKTSALLVYDCSFQEIKTTGSKRLKHLLKIL